MTDIEKKREEMVEVGKHYDSISRRTWIDLECLECGSADITPMGKRQIGKSSLCYFLCEKCGYRSKDLITYAIDGNVE